LITGGVISTTVMRKEQESEFPLESVTEIVTCVVVPTFNVDPILGV